MGKEVRKMTLQTYKEIHKNDTVEKLLYLITDEVYYISCDARSAGMYAANHSESNAKYYSKEVEHHKHRVAWLHVTILNKLKER